ncbi:MAG TPA: hypothetical protein VM889_04460 [Candidatus Thermoplasmatota archaeon]|nr:hypothetical protein [Candidatus Thermoplasmatota archaeon]
MTPRTLVILVTSALLAGAFAGTAIAYGTDADCRRGQYEEYVDEYGNTRKDDRIHDAPTYQNTPVTGRETGARACEGEHWDGQDYTGNECTPDNARPLASGGDVTSFAISSRYGCHPHTPFDGERGAGKLLTQGAASEAVHVRATGKGSTVGCLNHGAVFLGVSIFGVGEVAVFGNGDQAVVPGHPNCGSANAQGGGQGTASVYLRDNSDQIFKDLTTPAVAGVGPINVDDEMDNRVFRKEVCGNWLAGAVHTAGITTGQGVGETNDPTNSCEPNPDSRNDCTYQSYVKGQCFRDNTAASVMVLA